MNIEEFREYCLSMNGCTEDFPFGNETLVFKVGGKIFALTHLNRGDFTVNLKNLPAKNLQLREQYPEIIPGYHMNKKHWNTVDFSGRLPDSLLKNLLDESYAETVKNLPKSLREQFIEEKK